MQVFRLGEFFSGPGGMMLGALKSSALVGSGSEVDFKSVFAVDYHEDACSTFQRNIHGSETSRLHMAANVPTEGVPGINARQGEEAIVLNADVRFVDPTLLADIDGFSFGFPCNDFSMAGERKGVDGAFGGLYKAGVRVIEAKMPKFFVAENVSGLLNANDWGAFAAIMRDLRGIGQETEYGGYDVVAHLYKFEQYGVPQTRHRVIFVGIRKDYVEKGCVFRPPAPTFVTMTAEEALEGIFEAGSALPNNAEKKMSEIVGDRIRLTPPGKNIWDVNDTLPSRLQLHVKSAKLSSIYKVMDPKKPAYTVTGSGGGGTHMYHWDRRMTTDRERATLQTFPKEFEFVGNSGSVRRQIGMAVPPEGAAIIFAAVAKTLLGIPYDHVASNLSQMEDAAYIEKKIADRAKKRLDAELKARLAEEAAEDDIVDVVDDGSYGEAA